MKTRIISAMVMIAVVGVFLAFGLFYNPLFITAFVIFLSVLATYELLHNAAGITLKSANITAMAAAGLMVLFADANVANVLESYSLVIYRKNSVLARFVYGTALYRELLVAVLFFTVAAFIVLKNHKFFDLEKIFAFTAMPIIISFGFSFIGALVGGEHGLYYLLLLVDFACICDTGAYFTGVAIGKHKLCPEISPKKTVEGAIGGIVSAVLFAVIIMMWFNSNSAIPTAKMISTAVLTVPLCIVGMAGDLFASQIKRKVGIKDYSNLIPGHGGILDRFDSMLLIAPLLYVLSVYGVI